LQIADRDQSQINQRSSSRQVRESGFERHLALLQNRDRVRGATAADDCMKERRNGEKEKRQE